MLRAPAREVDHVGAVDLRRHPRVLGIPTLYYIHAVRIGSQSAEMPDAIRGRQLRVFLGAAAVGMIATRGTSSAQQPQNVAVHPHGGRPKLLAANQQYPPYQNRHLPLLIDGKPSRGKDVRIYTSRPDPCPRRRRPWPSTWNRNFGMTPVKIEVFPARGMKNATFKVGQTNVEFTEPLDPESAMGQYLKNFGPGPYHMAFGVTDIADKAGELSAKGQSDARRKRYVPQRRGLHDRQHPTPPAPWVTPSRSRKDSSPSIRHLTFNTIAHLQQEGHHVQLGSPHPLRRQQPR